MNLKTIAAIATLLLERHNRKDTALVATALIVVPACYFGVESGLLNPPIGRLLMIVLGLTAVLSVEALYNNNRDGGGEARLNTLLADRWRSVREAPESYAAQLRSYVDGLDHHLTHHDPAARTAAALRAAEAAYAARTLRDMVHANPDAATALLQGMRDGGFVLPPDLIAETGSPAV